MTPNHFHRTTLRLDRSRTSRAFRQTESLWTAELSRMLALVQQHVDALGSPTLEGPEDKPLLAIAIFGTYGSGKTSLLKTLEKLVNGTSRDEPGRDPALVTALQRLDRRIYSLPVLKPNLLAENQNFLYAFLATALEKEEERFRKVEGSESSPNPSLLSPVQQVFQKVSEYLQVLDDTRVSQEYDPLGISLERLERHTSDLYLHEEIGRLLDKLADTLTGEQAGSVVLLPVDDADMAKDKLVRTLDTYRRYLRHPRLVPVFTFMGQMAEEFMTVHFAEEFGGSAAARRIRETGGMVDQVALQYLAKLFPVRNRIKLGPAPSRVQRARFEFLDEYGDEYEADVIELLRAASALLFGFPEWPVAPCVRLALRPSTLRRQMQVLDAMHAAGVTHLLNPTRKRPLRHSLPPSDDPAAGNRVPAWVELFDRAAWSLLNAHRDALKEAELYLDDLYSWTPRGLREKVLSTVLGLDLEVRRKLLTRWNYRTEDRRSQVLSLLAATIFRPRLAEEEDTGDDPDDIYRRVLEARAGEPKAAAGAESAEEQAAGAAAGRAPYVYPTDKGFLWFLNLWIGFYLPQILARSRPDTSGSSRRRGAAGAPAGRFDASRIRGVGWNLRSGPVQAIRESLINEEAAANGMMFLQPKRFWTLLSKGRPQVRTLALIWCYWGYDRGLPWAAVSLWRGLALIGEVLTLNDVLTRAGAADEERRESLAGLLRKHFERSRIPGAPEKTSGEVPPENAISGEDEERWMDLGECSDLLVEELLAWSEAVADLPHLEPLAGFRTGLDEGGMPAGADQMRSWRRCIVRRLHGEDLLGAFWLDLEASHVGRSGSARDAVSVLTLWTEVVFDYWSDGSGKEENGKEKSGESSGPPAEAASSREGDGSGDGPGTGPLLDLLRRCPLLKPFDPASVGGTRKFLGEHFIQSTQGPGLASMRRVGAGEFLSEDDGAAPDQPSDSGSKGRRRK